MLVLLMGGNYELRLFDGVRCHDIRMKFHKDWFAHVNYTHVSYYTKVTVKLSLCLIILVLCYEDI
jgi:hypothetical protein